MEKKEIISGLQSLKQCDNIILSQMQCDAIDSACVIIKNASTREQWLLAIQKLGPLLVELGAKLLGP